MAEVMTPPVFHQSPLTSPVFHQSPLTSPVLHQSALTSPVYLQPALIPPVFHQPVVNQYVHCECTPKLQQISSIFNQSEWKRVLVTFPSSESIYGMGFSLNTTLYHEAEVLKAEHMIGKVEPDSVAAKIGLRDGQKLLGIGGINTDGMVGANLIAQFLATDVRNIQLIVQNPEEGHNTDRATQIYASLAEKQNMFELCVTHFERSEYIIPPSHCEKVKPVCLGDAVDGSCELIVSHHRPGQTCHIQHTTSEDYIKVEVNDQLMLHPLQQGDTSMQYTQESFACFDSCTRSPMVVSLFKLLNRTAYISVINKDQVGVQVLDPIQPDEDVLNSDDPRLFRYDPNTKTMMPTALPGYYLAANGDKVTLKKVNQENVTDDMDIKFRLR